MTLARQLEFVRLEGLSDNAAAVRAGISPPTFKRHKRKNPDFLFALIAAREDYRATHMGFIHKTAALPGLKGWRAAVWALQQAFPEDYCRPDRRGAQESGLQELTEAELSRAAEELNTYYSSDETASDEEP